MKRPLYIFLPLLLCVLPPLSVAAQSPPEKQPAPKPDKPISFEALLENRLQQMSPEQRQAEINRMADRGFLRPEPKYWAMIEKPETVLRLVSQSREPFTPPMLDALERVFPNFTDEKARFRAAEYLYRYRRPLGRDYLAKRLRETLDPNCAEIFALNRDAEMLPWVLQVLEKDADIIEAFEDWNSPEVNSALLKGFQKAPENSRFGTILSAHGDQRAVPLLRHIYKTAPLPNEGDDNLRKLFAAAALVRLHVPESDPLRRYLLQQLALPREKLPFQMWRMWVIVALGQTGDTRAVTALEQVIAHYLQAGVSAKEYALSMSSHDIAPDELAMYAAAALAHLQAASARTLVARLLLRVEADYKGKGPYNSLQYLNNWDGIARNLLDLNGSQAVVQQVMGQKWLHRERQLRRLRRMPVFVMPPDRFEPEMRE